MCAATLVWFRVFTPFWRTCLSATPGFMPAAAPYFRIFDPAATQAHKFDPRGDCVRRWVPEIDAPGYPRPIVDQAQARERALKALAGIKQL